MQIKDGFTRFKHFLIVITSRIENKTDTNLKGVWF